VEANGSPVKNQEELKPFLESMRGAARRREVVVGVESLQVDSARDENEFECYKKSAFCGNLQLPIRKLCRSACKPLPLDPGTWVITEVIEASGQPGCLSNHFSDQGQQNKLYWQLQVSLATMDKHTATWKHQDLTPPFLFNCFNPSLKVDPEALNIYFQRADLGIFEIDDLPFPSIFISASDLKQLKFPRDATSPEFFSKDLAIFQDDCYEWKIHNPTENKSLGELDFDRLYRTSQQDSIVKNKDYPGKLLFVKEWRENKVYSIDEKDFIKGDFKKHEEVKGLSFHTDITQASIFRGGDEYFWMYSCGKKLIIRNQQEDEDKENLRYFDSEGRSVCLEKPEDGCLIEENPLIFQQQTPEDKEKKQAWKGLEDGWVEVVDALSMSVKRVYFSTDRLEFTKRGLTGSAKRYDRQLEKLVSVCTNLDGPIHSTEQKGEFCYLSLRRGRRLCFYRNTLYAHLFHGQVHALDLLSHKVTVYPVK